MMCCKGVFSMVDCSVIFDIASSSLSIFSVSFSNLSSFAFISRMIRLVDFLSSAIEKSIVASATGSDIFCTAWDMLPTASSNSCL